MLIESVFVPPTAKPYSLALPEAIIFLTSSQVYSSNVLPATFAIIGKLYCSKNGNSRSIMTSTPGFCNPIAFHIPPGVPATRGVGFPIRGSSVAALIMIDPKRDKS